MSGFSYVPPLDRGLSNQPKKPLTIKGRTSSVTDPFPNRGLSKPFTKIPAPVEIPPVLPKTGVAAAVTVAAIGGFAFGTAIMNDAENPNGWLFPILDKIDRKLRGKGQGKPGKPKGGGVIEPSVPGQGEAGTVPNVQYRVRGTVDIGYGQGYNGEWVENFDSIVTGPLNAKEHGYNIDGTINGTSLVVGGQYVYQRSGSYNYYVKYSYSVSRVDGTSPQADRSQDPNKPPDTPGIKSQPGTTPTIGAKPTPQGIPKRPDGRPDIPDPVYDPFSPIVTGPGGYGGGTFRPSSPIGVNKNPKPDPPAKPKKPKPAPKPSPLPGAAPVTVHPSPPVTDRPTPVRSNPNPSPLPGTILQQISFNPATSMVRLKKLRG